MRGSLQAAMIRLAQPIMIGWVATLDSGLLCQVDSHFAQHGMAVHVG
jgi:hypothetical protein